MKRNAPQTVKTLRAITAAAANGSGAEESKVDERIRVSRLVAQEAHERARRRGRGHDDPRMRPAPAGAFDHDEYQAEEAAGSPETVRADQCLAWSRFHSPARASRMRRRPPHQIGRLIQNTPRQPTVSMSKPPTMGPRASAAPNTAPQMPIARARSVGSTKTWADDRQCDRVHHRSAEPPVSTARQ